MSTTAEARWTSCPRCSRRARAGQPFCELCGEVLRDSGQVPQDTDRGLRCTECGASVRVPASERATSCPFCGASYVAAAEMDASRFAPEFVLPFAVGKPAAEIAFKGWMGKSRWFVPGDLSLQGRLASLRGVYIPFWSFSIDRKSTRLNSSHIQKSRMPSSA